MGTGFQPARGVVAENGGVVVRADLARDAALETAAPGLGVAVTVDDLLEVATGASLVVLVRPSELHERFSRPSPKCGAALLFQRHFLPPKTLEIQLN
jgi:hypothetical protein